MCQKGTIGRRIAHLIGLILVFLLVPALAAQVRLDWQHIGNSAVDLSLASAATGPVNRVWYSVDGTRLMALTASGRVFQTDDFETWQPAPGTGAPPVDPAPAVSLPEAGARIRAQRVQGARLYAAGRFVYRSEDGGGSWLNLTGYRNSSILGEGLRDLAVSPHDEDEIVVAGVTGIWRSLDGGASWTGLNQSLPNLPVQRILSVPGGSRGVQIALGSRFPVALVAAEWDPGQKQAWRPAASDELVAEAAKGLALSRQTSLGPITALAIMGDVVYVGSTNGRLWASQDGGRNWSQFMFGDAGTVEAFYVDPANPRLALAAIGGRPADSLSQAGAPHIVRTFNGGAFWDDLTANLPDVAAHGVTVDFGTGAVYAATDRGVFLSFQNLTGGAQPASWIAITGDLPAAAAMDVRLGASGNHLYVALDGYGVYMAAAPHRARDPRVVNAADYSLRAAAPGSLLSVLGGKLQAAHVGDLDVPVLAASEAESQIQVPFEVKGTALQLDLDAPPRKFTLAVPLLSASPAIFVEPDGTPMLLAGDTGVMLDAMTPARSSSQIQILATGLGLVKGNWSTGVPAPLENPPQVAAIVHAYLDNTPLQVTRATLAPGYVGFYVVEVVVPRIVNAGPADLYLEVDGHESNHVRVYIEP